jgi:hypothetical protein
VIYTCVSDRFDPTANTYTVDQFCEMCRTCWPNNEDIDHVIDAVREQAGDDEIFVGGELVLTIHPDLQIPF